MCSPHILSLRERVAVDTEPITPVEFDELVSSHKQTLLQCREQEASALSHFEVMTALAFKHFQQKQVSILARPAHIGMPGIMLCALLGGWLPMHSLYGLCMLLRTAPATRRLVQSWLCRACCFCHRLTSLLLKRGWGVREMPQTCSHRTI